MLLELVGYEPVSEGVFKGARPFKLRSREDHNRVIAIREIIGLQKFRAPDEDEVVAYVRATIDDYCNNPEKYEGNSSGLIGLLNTLDDNVVDELFEGSETEEFLRRNTVRAKRAEGELPHEFLVLTVGHSREGFLERVIDNVENSLERFNEIFGRHFSDGVKLGAYWSVHFRVNDLSLDQSLYEGVLPSRKEIKKLIAHEVTSSRTMEVAYGEIPSRGLQIYETVADAISEQMHLDEVADISEVILDNFGVRVVTCFKEEKENLKKAKKLKEKESQEAKKEQSSLFTMQHPAIFRNMPN
ncbi:MAG: hypothetical protein AABW58_03270 [Nanoarchaeota archaeon]